MVDEPQSDTQSPAFGQILPGSPNRFGDPVVQVFVRESRYIIYQTEGRDLVWESQPALNERVKALRPLVTELRAIYGPRLRDDAVALELLVSVVTHGLRDEQAEAEALFERAKQRGIRIRRAGGRLRYLVAGVGAGGAMMLTLVAVLLWLPSVAPMTWVASFGALGAFFSMSLGLRQLTVDIDDPWFMTVASGATRVGIGAVAAVAIVTLIRGNLVLGVLADLDAFGFQALGFLAGFSERFVPNVLARSAQDLEVEGVEGS